MLFGCCLIQFGGTGVLANCIGIFFPPVCQELGFSTGEISLHITIRGVFTVLFLPIAGKLITKIKLRYLLTAAVLMLSVSIGSMAFFSSLYQWYIASIFYGIGGAFLFLTVCPIILTNWFMDKAGLAIGIAMSFSGLGGVIMNPLGTWFIAVYGWRATYLMFAVVGAACMLPATLFILKFTPQESGIKPYVNHGRSVSTAPQSPVAFDKSIWDVMRSPVFWLLMPVILIIAFMTVYAFHFPQYALSIQLSPAAGAAMVSASMAANIVGKLGLGWLSKKYTSKITTLIGTAITAAGFACIWLFPSVLPVLIAGSFLYGICMAMTGVSIPLLVSELFGHKNYAMILSIASMATSLIGGVGMALVGFLYDISGSYTLCFAVAIISCLVLVLLINRIYRLQPVIKYAPVALSDLKN